MKKIIRKQLLVIMVVTLVLVNIPAFSKMPQVVKADEIVEVETGVVGETGDWDTVINATNFPDTNFRAVVEDMFSNWCSSNRIATPSETDATNFIEDTTAINVANNDISNLKGIEMFTNLESLNCRLNRLTSLDVNNCTSLKRLKCSGNRLESLGISNCTNLEELYCDGNELTSLDVSIYPKLKMLSCSYNYLTSLDVSPCESLVSLYCENNKLTSLDVSDCINLNLLSCNENKLTSLDVSPCESLGSLYCESNNLIDIKGARSSYRKFYAKDQSKTILVYKNNKGVYQSVNSYPLEIGHTMSVVGYSYKDRLFYINELLPATFTTAVTDKFNVRGTINFIQAYVVQFVDYNGEVLKTDYVESGKSAAEPMTPSRDGYTFTGWNKAFDNITDDVVVTAQYSENKTDGVLANKTNNSKPSNAKDSIPLVSIFAFAIICIMAGVVFWKKKR